MGSRVIGVDEAGRGPVIGPLVICAFNIPKTDYSILEKIGIKDSKKITKKKRQKIYDILIENGTLRDWHITVNICNAYEIDIKREQMNINLLEVKLFAETICSVSIKRSEEDIYLDACDVIEERFGKLIRTKLGILWENNIIISKHKMDENNLVVAAASIIAKVTRDQEIEKISKGLDFEIGSGYPSDPKTIIAIREMVKGEYPHKDLRWSWKTTKVAWESQHKSKVPLRKAIFDSGAN